MSDIDIFSLNHKFTFVDKNFSHTILKYEYPELYKQLFFFFLLN